MKRLKDVRACWYLRFLFSMACVAAICGSIAPAQAGGPWQARHGLTSAQYQNVFNELTGQGYRLIDVSGYSVGGQDRYAAIWEKREGPAWQARHGLTSAQYQNVFMN
jgi:hypothetical protein